MSVSDDEMKNRKELLVEKESEIEVLHDTINK